MNQTEVRVIGMSRSGNHAIISWMLAQVRGRFCFLNCCEGKENPFASAREMDDGSCFQTNMRGFDLAAERAGDFRPKDWLVHSYEDSFLGNVCSRAFERHHDRWVGSSSRRIDVVIVRDPFNLFASRLRMGHAVVGQVTARKIWQQHAKQLVAVSPHLRHEALLVRYDRWVREPGYRRRLAKRLGLDFSDAGIDRVPTCAGGSSFDGITYDGRASGMDVFGRWRAYVDDPVYLATFDDPLLRTARAVFGDSEAARVVSHRVFGRRERKRSAGERPPQQSATGRGALTCPSA